jgi:hypothetical protein
MDMDKALDNLSGMRVARKLSDEEVWLYLYQAFTKDLPVKAAFALIDAAKQADSGLRLFQERFPLPYKGQESPNG